MRAWAIGLRPDGVTTPWKEKQPGLTRRNARGPAIGGTTRLGRGFDRRGAWPGLTRRNASSQGTGGKEGTACVDSTSGQRVDSAREEGEGGEGERGRGRVRQGREEPEVAQGPAQALNAVLQSSVKRRPIQGSKAEGGGASWHTKRGRPSHGTRS